MESNSCGNNLQARKINGDTHDADRKIHESSSQDEILQKGKSRIFDRPVHKPRISLFSTSSGYTNYRGFLNLCLVLLMLSSARLLLENIIKYGVLVDPIQWTAVVLADPHRWPCITVCLASNIFVFIALKLEQHLHKETLSEKTGVALQLINLTALLIFPAVAIFFVKSYLLAAFSTMMWHCCLLLKLISYVMVNRWYRLEARGRISSHQFQHPEKQLPESKVVSYPDNLTVGNLAYFCVAPTLCYELNFPRTPSIRKVYLAKRVAEILLLSQLNLALAQQWLLPIMHNSVAPLRDSDWSRIMERLLKLAIPNHLMWLIFFYLFFHSFCNALAEVLRFADREFYRDWWNAETVQEFWRNWNMPVHRWALRHVYAPIVDNGHSKLQAACVVFLVSAFFHEYMVSVPLGIFRLWAFMGMLSQLPYAMLVEKLSKAHSRAGNMAVWFSLIVGQPLAILMYFHDYYIQKRQAGEENVVLA